MTDHSVVDSSNKGLVETGEEPTGNTADAKVLVSQFGKAKL